MNIELFKNVNFDALPRHIKSQFDNVYGRFFEITPFVLCNKDAYEHFDMIYLITNDENDDSISDADLGNFIEWYESGFTEGYNNFEKMLSSIPFLEAVEETKAYRIFSLVYNRSTIFNKFPLTEDGAIYRMSRQAVQTYGKEVGIFVRAWDYILNNANVFEKVFAEKEASMHPSQAIKFHGTPTQLTELTKALIANGNLKGIQSEIFKKLSTFFNVEIKDPDQTINKIKNRNNGSETLFLDTLILSLKQDQNKNSKGK
ncbi:RteC domain-containing protein [Flavobacterium sp.]|uniref:RteC domain-containing protein n=1 Tax=Flavobacterium sp. TaxID=239 RepID=UPI0040343E01